MNETYMIYTNSFTWEDITCVSKISVANIANTSWFTLTNLTSTDRSTWVNIISTKRLSEQTLLG